MAPIFIIGTERSGSNLLRLILNSHPNIVIPHPPHVMRYFAPLVGQYGDLSDPARFRRLVDDVLALVHAHIHPWPWVPTADEIVSRATHRDLLGVYGALHDALAAHEHKPRWGCKSTFMIDQAAEVVARYPGARLLWLYRDPRDVAASSRKSVFSTFHPYMSGQLWTTHQKQGLALEATGVPLLRLKYEDMVGAADVQMRRVCDYLGEDFHPPMLEFFKGREAKMSATLSESWQNTAAPIKADGLERWRKDLTAEEVLAVEAVAGPTMEALGYPPSCSAEDRARTPGATTMARWWAEDQAAWLQVEARSLRKDKNVALRWKRAVVLEKIRWRLRLGG